MAIIGYGVDLVELEQFTTLLNDVDSDFAQRCFTTAEMIDADAPAIRIQRLAGRFAAKEAVAKALGTGFDGKVSPL